MSVWVCCVLRLLNVMLVRFVGCVYLVFDYAIVWLLIDCWNSFGLVELTVFTLL